MVNQVSNELKKGEEITEKFEIHVAKPSDALVKENSYILETEVLHTFQDTYDISKFSSLYLTEDDRLLIIGGSNKLELIPPFRESFYK